MIFVKKLDGRSEKYYPSKLRKSLSNSGADEETTNKIMAKVDKILYKGIETKKLFKFALNEFKKYKPYGSSRYNLKNAILRLDHEGFHFESLVAKVIQKKGYSVKLNQIVNGKHIKHEIDISAEKGQEKLMIECKHHAKPWLGTDIRTALYVYARFIDTRKWFTMPMLVTNTRFSSQVVTYSKGIGLKLMGWKCPKDDSLEYYIEKFKIYPVTMLSILDRKKIFELLRLNILLISDLSSMDAKKISRILKISKSKADRILEEAKALCEP
jgi:Holliday junction resolvase|tara:strand:+ start:123 stop:929 length:807 start_codon:yes stop_codon:yes gene_type:complete